MLKLMKSLLPAGDPAYKPLHLGTNCNSMGRWKKKVMAKEDWYRDGTGEKEGLGGSKMGGKRKKISQQDGKIQTNTVIFISSTRFRVKMQEAGGIQLARLFSNDIARGEPYGREDCHPCKASSGRPNCKQLSILYESTCDNCNPDWQLQPTGREPSSGGYRGEQEGGEEERNTSE
jgi:hypothetical protein